MLLLVDISMWNVFVNYGLLASRCDGAYIKATDGPSLSVDKHGLFNSGFNTHWEETKKANMPRGAYHFWTQGASAVRQARLFFDTVSATGDLGEFPPALDVEMAGDGANVFTCIREIERLFQRTPILYTREGVFTDPVYQMQEIKKSGEKSSKKSGKDKKKQNQKKVKLEKVQVAGLTGDLSWGERYPLWVANYLMDDLDETVEEKQLLPWSEDLIERWVTPSLGSFPKIPKVHKKKGWAIWQFVQIGDGADWGQDPINSKQIDLDVFNGSLKELVALGRPDGLPADWVDRTDLGGALVTTGTIPPQDPGDPDSDDDPPEDVKPPAPEPTYPGKSNQDILNLFHDAANLPGWWDWVVRAELTGLAASQEVRAQAYNGPKFEDLPGLKKAEKKNLLNFLSGKETPVIEAGFWVRVKEKSTECRFFVDSDEGRDKKKKPIMITFDPPVTLDRGASLWVSADRKESDLDSGDGVILASGREPYYYILASPDNEKAVKTYVKAKDTLVQEK